MDAGKRWSESCRIEDDRQIGTGGRFVAFYVVGGEFRDTSFRDLVRPDAVVGPFESYEDAYVAWRARAMATIDNANARYQIVETAPMPEFHGVRLVQESVPPGTSDDLQASST